MRCRRKMRNRRGVATLELILVVPILLIVLIFSIQFGIVAIYQATVTHAATVAAREAGKGADLQTVVEAVRTIVGIQGIDITDDTGSGTKVVLEDGDSGDPPLVFGDPLFDCPTPENDPDPIQVRATVCVDLMVTRFSDALASWGVTFAGRRLKASSLVMKEYEQDLGLPDWPDD